MNKFVIALIFIVPFVLILQAKFFVGSGNIVSEVRNIGDFNKIEFNLIGSLEIIQNADELVKIETDDNIIAIIETVVENGILKIGTVNEKSFNNVKKLKICVSVKNLNSVKVSGVCSVDVQKLKTESLKLILNGVGSFNIQDLETELLDAQLTGVGSLNINSGAAKKTNDFSSRMWLI